MQSVGNLCKVRLIVRELGDPETDCNCLLEMDNKWALFGRLVCYSSDTHHSIELTLRAGRVVVGRGAGERVGGTMQWGLGGAG